MIQLAYQKYLSALACLMFASVCAPALAQEFAVDFDNQYFDTGYVVQTRSQADADTVDSVINEQRQPIAYLTTQTTSNASQD